MKNFDAFIKVNKEKGKAYPVSGKKEKINVVEMSGYEQIIHEKIESFLEGYEQHKKLFHDGGSMARIYKLPYEDTTLVIKEMRDPSKRENGFIINSPERELKIQDELRQLGIRVPLPVSFVSIFGIDYKKRESIDKELIIMEEIRGLSIGDYYRRFQRGSSPLLPDNFSVEVFMEKLRKEIDKMHQNNYFHRDLTINNVMIDSDANPIIIDFGTSTRTSFSDPYEGVSTPVIKNGRRLNGGGSIRFANDEESLVSIEHILREMVR